jgi:hypothetical protein
MDHPYPQPPRHPTDRLVGMCPAMAALRTQMRHLTAFDTLGNPAVPTVLGILPNAPKRSISAESIKKLGVTYQSGVE